MRDKNPASRAIEYQLLHQRQNHAPLAACEKRAHSRHTEHEGMEAIVFI